MEKGGAPVRGLVWVAALAVATSATFFACGTVPEGGSTGVLAGDASAGPAADGSGDDGALPSEPGSPGAVTDGSSPDAADDGAPSDDDGGGDDGGDDGAPLPQGDAFVPVTCDVTFVVTQAAVADAGAGDGVRVVGDVVALGAWSPAAAVPLSPLGGNVWAGHHRFSDGAYFEFKFIERSAGATTWEDLGGGSNRSMRVSCNEGLEDGGGAGPAVGTVYVGVFGARPADAT